MPLVSRNPFVGCYMPKPFIGECVNQCCLAAQAIIQILTQIMNQVKSDIEYCVLVNQALPLFASLVEDRHVTHLFSDLLKQKCGPNECTPLNTIYLVMSPSLQGFVLLQQISWPGPIILRMISEFNRDKQLLFYDNSN